jgi:hypothetical protein
MAQDDSIGVRSTYGESGQHPKETSDEYIGEVSAINPLQFGT